MAEIDGSTGWRLARAISRIAGSKASGSESGTATYAGTDASGVSWVRLPGADADTPVNGSTVADARPGDSVSYAIEDGRLSITGNASDPAVGATRMGAAVSVVQAALDSARSTLSAAISTAQSVADAAKGVAEATNQHFWTDTDGVHVTEATQDEWATDETGANMLLNSAGQLFRDGLNNLISITTTAGARALTIWDGTGNASSNIRAIFGSTITIGGESDANLYIDGDSIDMRDGSDTLLTIEADVPTDTYYDKESVIKIGGTNPASIQMYTSSINDNRKVTIDSGYNSYVSAIRYDQRDVHGSYGGYDFVKVAGDGIIINETGYADMGQAAKCLNIQSGTMGVGTVNAGSYKDVSITFPAYYDAAPTVVVGFATTSVDGSFGKCCVAVYSTSATGFTARIYNGDNWARSPRITWIAMP